MLEESPKLSDREISHVLADVIYDHVTSRRVERGYALPLVGEVLELAEQLESGLADSAVDAFDPKLDIERVTLRSIVKLRRLAVLLDKYF